MKIDISMVQEQKFAVGAWWADDPAYVVKTLRAQLEAAKILWPEELDNFEISEERE